MDANYASRPTFNPHLLENQRSAAKTLNYFEMPTTKEISRALRSVATFAKRNFVTTRQYAKLTTHKRIYL
jgi:hypothetical protein